MEAPLAGKVAVVTGAGRGIGRDIARALASAGAGVVLAGRSSQPLKEVAADLGQSGSTALAVPTDVTDVDAVENLATCTIDAFGHVDIVVNNSGVLSTTALLDQPVEDWDRIFATNVRGTFLVTRALGKYLVAQGHGKVINVASNFALKGVALHAAYSSSKAAVLGFTRAMAAEWARYNVQVNALAPGYFATDLNVAAREDPPTYERIVRGIPARRVAEAQELGPWVILLAGPASDFMTGATIVIDGGQTA
jgi:NAD(P)-dependent dehydrogenase (short-subunit alcohol dehydrogenase family)